MVGSWIQVERTTLAFGFEFEFERFSTFHFIFTFSVHISYCSDSCGIVTDLTIIIPTNESFASFFHTAK